MKNFKLNKFLFLLIILQGVFAFSQEKQITGKIIDEASMPIPGATVLVKGTSVGTTTDFDGKYQLKVPSNSNILKFSYIGYETIEVAIGNQTTINITLKESAAQLDEILITGFRGAEQRAIAFKREAMSVVEAITPEDIGNYSDENIADALQRVPGLQVERDDSGNGGGDRVSVRGVGPQFVNISVNGRTPLSAGSEGIDQLRQFNLDVLPTEVVQGAVVYKSSEAHLIEPGLGGAVDFQTIKPLSLRYKDGSNSFAVVNIRGDYNDFGDNQALKPRLSGLLGLRSDDNKFGIVLSAITSSANRAFDSYNMGYISRNIRENTADGIVTHTGVLSPNLTRFNPVRNSVDRVGISTAMQFKMGEHWEANADFLFTEFNNYSTRNQFRLFPQLETNNTLFPSADLNIDEDNVLRGFNTTSSNNPISRTAIVPTQYDNLQSSYMAGFNLKWENNGWKIATDYSLSNIDFDQRLTFSQTFINVPWMSFDLTGDYGVFGFDQAEVTNFDNAVVQDYAFLRDIMFKGENHAIRLDIEKELSANAKVKLGGRYSSTELDSRQAQLAGAGQPWSADYLDEESYFNTYVTGTLDPAFAEGRNIGGNRWLTVDQALIRANNPAVFNRTAGSSFEGDLFNVTDGELPLLTANSWTLEENTTALYGQLDFKSEFMGVPVSGNIGVRGVKWEVEGRAFSTITIAANVDDDTGATSYAGVPTTAASSRWDVMPSLNLTLALKDNFNLRLSAVNTVSRPDYLDLRPTNTVRFIDPNSENAGINGTATLSNPNLQPFSSWQFDATGEWYNKAGGAFVLSGFYKLIDDFIISETTFDSKLSDYGDINFDTTGVTDEVLDGQILNVTSPVNFTGVNLYGFEVGFRQPLGFISDTFKSFGVQANYTYVDSKFDEEINSVDNSFPGSSKHNFNSVLYYDGKLFGVRVAYNTRSSFLRNIGGGSDIRSNITYTDGFDRLDVRANLEVTKDLQLSVSAQNLTASDRRDYINNDPTLFTQLTRQGAVYTVGARYKF
ncbi:TonB-dependent receptor [Mariniflexile fucanivorans]|uniref:TonB-dependent receptor n=1 Tax=Mariniflexile fucanivorans TaxID=264023 RepID=A0A4R1RKU8_9FLAO|nr:TonB-dependent receptor [Mariniflexile fucanivorans]TCL66828.1 TonB-dependent receptor [Mariniflexile fucanivorans]